MKRSRMFRIIRRRPVEAGVRFCDGCGEVSTAGQRAERHYDHTRAQALPWAAPR